MRHALLLALLLGGCSKGFDDYTKKAKASEAKVQLMKLQSTAKQWFATNAAFPKGSAPLTPATPCCKQDVGGKKKCKGNAPGDWDNPAWQAVDFSMFEDFYFQYSYESDGKTFTARAVGDPGCDGAAVTYEAKGTIEGGNPVFTQSGGEP